MCDWMVKDIFICDLMVKGVFNCGSVCMHESVIVVCQSVVHHGISNGHLISERAK